MLGTGALTFSLITSLIAGTAARAAEAPEGQDIEQTEGEEPPKEEQPENIPPKEEQPEGGPSEEGQPEDGPSEEEPPEGGPSEEGQPEGGPSEEEQPEDGPSEEEQPEEKLSEEEQPEKDRTENGSPENGGDKDVPPVTKEDDGSVPPDADDSTVKEGGSKENLNPDCTEDILAEGTQGAPDYGPVKGKYADAEIPVWGYTEDATVYSVDVEWGAMTFQWEGSGWDSKNHIKTSGAGWKVYDTVSDRALDDTEHEINEIKVTNYSNAPIWATFDYKSADDYASDTTGIFRFEKETDDDYLFLGTADNAGSEDDAGTPTVAKAYFMPNGLKDELQIDGGIAKWAPIGTVTVGIKTNQPAKTQTP